MLAEYQKTPSVPKQEFWQQHIEECKRSTLSQTQYCRTHGLALSTFGYWKRRLQRSRICNPRFYPLTVQPLPQKVSQPSNSGLSLHLGNDKFRLDISEDFSVPTLKKLITTLDQL